MDFNNIKKKLSKIYVASVKLGRLMINNKDWLKDCVKGDFKDWNTETSDSLNALSIVARDGEILRNCDADIADFNEAKKLISSKANSRIVNKYYYLAKKEQDFKHLTELGDKFADSDIKLLKDLTGKVNFSKVNFKNVHMFNFGLMNWFKKSKSNFDESKIDKVDENKLKKVTKEVHEIIREQLRVKGNIQDGKTLEDYDADDLDKVEIAMTLEEEFGIYLNESDIMYEGLTIGDLCKLVTSKIKD